MEKWSGRKRGEEIETDKGEKELELYRGSSSTKLYLSSNFICKSRSKSLQEQSLQGQTIFSE